MRTLSIEQFSALGSPHLVYVRPLSGSELLSNTNDAELRQSVAADQVLYAVHRADGQRLAVLTDRESAFAAAYEHELTPVSVH